MIIAADRTPVDSDRVQHLAFLGREATWPQGAWILASLLKVPVLAVFCYRHQQQFEVHVHKIADVVNLPRKDRLHAMQQVTGRYVTLLEQHCLRAPYQWFNFYHFGTNNLKIAASTPITVGLQPLQIEDVVQVAHAGAKVALPNDTEWRGRIQRGADFLDELLQRDGVIYGVTTGYGDSCLVNVPAHQVHELPLHLSRFHGCGLGQNLDLVSARAVVLVRLCSLARGFSGVSLTLLERLTWMLNENIIPVIPSEGSVGASGDLTPLSYIAATLIGEREVYYQGEIVPVADVYRAKGIQSLVLRPKEGLALMNGTAVMTALACLNYMRAAQLSTAATLVTALNVVALDGNPSHFDEVLFAQKPHPGQQKSRHNCVRGLTRRLKQRRKVRVCKIVTRYVVRLM